MALLTCPKCRKHFNSSTALGGGWRGTSKVLGCPECRTFFVRAPYLDVLCVILGLANLLFAGPYILYYAVILGNDGRLLNGGVALMIGAWLVLGNWCLFKKNVRGDAAVYIPPWERT